MNAIEGIKEDLARRFPGLPVSLDEPAEESGPWFLDVQRDDGLPPVVVEWRPGVGFGVSTPGEYDYGVGADEIYKNAEDTLERVIDLIRSGAKTGPPKL